MGPDDLFKQIVARATRQKDVLLHVDELMAGFDADALQQFVLGINVVVEAGGFHTQLVGQFAHGGGPETPTPEKCGGFADNHFTLAMVVGGDDFCHERTALVFCKTTGNWLRVEPKLMAFISIFEWKNPPHDSSAG
jgi:hypothetical protein